MTDAVDFSYYGLRRNPYRNQRLDPRVEDDRRLLVELQALPPHDEIEEHITRTTRSDEQSTAFLLSGRAGAGRTTMAYRIFHQYREILGIDDTFHQVEVGGIDHDSPARINRILKAIRNTVIRKHPDRRDALMEKIPDAGPRGDLDLQLQADFLADVTRQVVPRMHLGLLIEGVQDDGFMDTLSVVFQYVPAVIVVTRDDYKTADTASAERLAARREWQQWAMHLHLPPLGGTDVELVAANRWHSAAGAVECPFELDGVRSAFNQRRQPIAAAIGWLAWLLEGRLTGYRGDKRWPEADELRLPAKWIEDMVQWGANAPRERNDHG
jgi:hypothetical protein